MNAYELRVRGLETKSAYAAARWELLACAEVRDLVKAPGSDRFLVLYEGEWERPEVWCRVLASAGYDAAPLGHVDQTKEAS